MPLTVASWNIEKSGESSTYDKRSKVSNFIHLCCGTYGFDVVFLCEVHSARVGDYVDFLRDTYRNYAVDPLGGGYSNNYILLVRTDAGLQVDWEELRGLNRGILLVRKEEQLGPPPIGEVLLYYVALAHFKSGQTGLTRDQLESAADWLAGATGQTGRWAITGDMNWDFRHAGELQLQSFAQSYTCWLDQTQVKGGILDWCMAGPGMGVAPQDLTPMFPPETFDMTGPDHRPVVFLFQ